ncbi:PIG-L family deacetylase [Promicromonospora sukumoe]|uniref:PIG-L family deacetylase n=1 Tax=Promicromonospora sukumoe TaxID=88382 RepID=UPI00365730E4
MLAVHAHPDDETLSTGGLLAAFAAAGLPARVVTCTRGERGEVIALPGTTSEGRAGLEGDGPALGAYRETELARAVPALGGWVGGGVGADGSVAADGADGVVGGVVGAVEQTFLDAVPTVSAQVNRVVGAGSGLADPARYEDSGMEWVAPGVAGPAPDSPPTAFARVPLDEPAGRLATLIRAWRPAVVATYEPGGGYGHPDHVRAHEVTVRALRLAADPTWRPDAGGEPAGDATPGDDVGRRGEPWGGAELWQAVAPAEEVRAARATLAALPAALALVAEHGLTLPSPDDALPPFAKDDLTGWSAEGQVIGTSGDRSPDVLPIVRRGRVARVDVRGVLGRVVGAMRAHATQVQHATVLTPAEGPVAGWYALSNGVLTPILTTETYVVVDPND